MGWFDNHCHIHDEGLGNEAVQRSLSNGVEGMITVGCDLPTSLAAIATAEANASVWATVGLHPHDASLGLDGLEALLAHPKVVAVGECGLDYFYDHSPRDIQRPIFEQQIAWAHEYDLPLVIHTRDAWDDTFEILASSKVPRRTIFHCFTGGPNEAEKCLALGAYLSFSGIVTFKNSADNKAAATMCPADRLMVETDAPFLTPDPFRGRKNEPWYVSRVGEVIAGLRGVPVDEIQAATTANARLVYGL